MSHEYMYYFYLFNYTIKLKIHAPILYSLVVKATEYYY